MIFEITEIEKAIGYTFKDKMLLRKCFTHASYAHEHGGEDNEKLEFFGDAIMDFIVTEYLVKNKFGDEGDLTKLRASIVSKPPLLYSVKKMGLEKFLLLGKGVKNLDYDEKLFSSVYEAIVAGIYYDGGLEKAKKFVLDTIIADFNKKTEYDRKEKISGESKSRLQEYVQKRKIGSISYETLSVLGPAHMPEFKMAVLLNGKKLAEGKASSKKEAEAKAAEKAYKLLKKQEGKKS